MYFEPVMFRVAKNTVNFAVGPVHYVVQDHPDRSPYTSISVHMSVPSNSEFENTQIEIYVDEFQDFHRDRTTVDRILNALSVCYEMVEHEMQCSMFVPTTAEQRDIAESIRKHC